MEGKIRFYWLNEFVKNPDSREVVGRVGVPVRRTEETNILNGNGLQKQEAAAIEVVLDLAGRLKVGFGASRKKNHQLRQMIGLPSNGLLREAVGGMEAFVELMEQAAKIRQEIETNGKIRPNDDWKREVRGSLKMDGGELGEETTDAVVREIIRQAKKLPKEKEGKLMAASRVTGAKAAGFLYLKIKDRTEDS